MWGTSRGARGARLLLAAVVALLGAAILSSGVAAARPSLQLPWPTGQSWIYLGGPHNTNGCANGGFTCVNPRPWNSLDFTTASRHGTVTAAASGVVQSTNQCPAKSNFVIINHGDGWHTTYYHLINIRVHPGQHVVTGQPLGDISEKHGCGGHANTAHVHFSVAHYSGPYSWHKGQVDLGGFQIGDWIFHDGPTQYSGCATNVSTGERVCPGGVLSNSPSSSPATHSCSIPGGAEGGTGTLPFTTVGVSCAQGQAVIEAGGQGSTWSALGFQCQYLATPQPGAPIRCTQGSDSVTWNAVG